MADVEPEPAQLTRYEALLRASASLASYRSIPDLLKRLSHDLRGVLPFDHFALALHDPGADVLRLVLVEPLDELRPPGSTIAVTGSGPTAVVFRTQQPLVVHLGADAVLTYDGAPLPMLTYYRDRGGKVMCILPLRTATSRIGVLGFGSREEAEIAPDTIAFMEFVASQVAIAVENASNFDQARRYQEELREHSERLALLLEINNLLVTRLEYGPLVDALAEMTSVIGPALQRAAPHDYASVTVFDAAAQTLRLRAVARDQQRAFDPDVELPLGDSPAGTAVTARTTQVFREE